MIAIGALCWNQPLASRLWIESTRRNSGSNDIKILAIDNGSTDNGETWAEVQKADWFEHNDQNENLSKGYNRLIKKSLEMGAEYVCLASNDIVVGPRWLDALVREIRLDRKRCLVPHDGVLKYRDEVDRDTLELLKKIEPSTGRGYNGACIFLTPEAIAEFLPIPEGLVLWFCDAWIYHCLGKAGYGFDVVLDSLIFHQGSLSFYKREGYVQIVAQDEIVYKKAIGEIS